MLKIIIAEDDPAMRIVLKKAQNDILGLEVVGEVENDNWFSWLKK